MSGKSKYKAIKTVVDGIKFDSKSESIRYGELKLLEKAEKICRLRLQPEFELIVNDILICKYRGDFQYNDLEKLGAPLIIEDRKGFKTRDYVIKKKLMKAIYNIDILET